MKKVRPDADKLANELAGGSAFFRKPTPAPAPATPEVTPSSTQETAHQPESRPPDRPGRPARRHMIRHAFELYMDQLDSLRDLADDQRRRGEPASMSRMVREAIDRFLDEQPPTA